MARPFKDIDWDLVQKFLEAGSDVSEISAKFRVQKQTFYRRFQNKYGVSFQNYYSEMKEPGLADIRLAIHSKALDNKEPGNSNLLIFLAKCRLGMREPDIIQNLSPNQFQIDQSHRIMQLEHENQELREFKKNANKF